MTSASRSKASAATATVPRALISPSLPLALIVAAVVVGVAALVPLAQSSNATSTKGSVQELERQRDDWRARVQELEMEVATMGSLNRIEKEAIERLKMEAPQDVRYMRIDEPAPRERKLPSRFLPPQVARDESGSSIWEKAFGWLPLP
jgi:cell division protein FtsL